MVKEMEFELFGRNRNIRKDEWIQVNTYNIWDLTMLSCRLRKLYCSLMSVAKPMFLSGCLSVTTMATQTLPPTKLSDWKNAHKFLH